MNWQGMSHPGEHGMSSCFHLCCLRRARPTEVNTWGTSLGESSTWATACLCSGSELWNQMVSLWGLLFEGHLLTYDPMYNVTEWVPVCRMAADLSSAEDSSVQELSNITTRSAGCPQDGTIWGMACEADTGCSILHQNRCLGGDRVGFPVGGGQYRCTPCRVSCRV